MWRRAAGDVGAAHDPQPCHLSAGSSAAILGRRAPHALVWAKRRDDCERSCGKLEASAGQLAGGPALDERVSPRRVEDLAAVLQRAAMAALAQPSVAAGLHQLLLQPLACERSICAVCGGRLQRKEGHTAKASSEKAREPHAGRPPAELAVQQSAPAARRLSFCKPLSRHARCRPCALCPRQRQRHP
jgi:hypothetical protein